MTRELRGRAILPHGLASISEPRSTPEDMVGNTGTGITVSHDSGLEFLVERESSWSGELFPTQTKELVITKSSPQPFVFFKGARVCSQGGSVTSWFSAQIEGDSKWIKQNRPRRVNVWFAPQNEGLYEATLELTFCIKHKADFVIKRALCGWAKPSTGVQGRQIESGGNSGSQSTNDFTDEHAAVSVDEEELLDSDGTGISVSHGDALDFGIVERKRANGPFATPSSLLTVELADGFPAVMLVKEKISTLDGTRPDFVAVFVGDSRNIRPGTESTVRIIFSPKFQGLFKATLELIFYDNERSVWFVVRRRLQGIAGSLQDHKHLESLGRGNDDKLTKNTREVPPWKVIPLLSPAWHRKSSHIPDYEVPPIVQDAVEKSTVTCPYDRNASALVSALRPDSLNKYTHAHYFKALLNIEDGQQQWDVRCHRPYQVEVQRRGQLYDVEIENDDEDLLPEVALGDFLWLDDPQEYIRYEARITNIDVFTRRHLAVLKMSLRLPTNFIPYRGAQFTVILRHNRISLRRQYHALSASFAAPCRLLFPSVSDIKSLQPLSRPDIHNLKLRLLVNRTIRDDHQQLQAIVSILEQPKGSVPFIIYGPPGTGKTSVVVESIVQLVLRDDSVRILACTPSNVATDNLVARLVAAGLGSDKLYHPDASSSHDEDMSEDTQTFSSTPEHARLLAFRVVVSTCSSAGMLQALTIPVGHFSHIVIDEAGQAEEPLAMIPITTFSNSYTNVILAGDPNQLGPVIKSPVSAKAGLRKSYLERLMLMREVYGLDTQVGKTIAVLERNRRSHGAIIAWSNRYLYEDTLREYGNTHITYHLVHSNVLPKKGFPVVFHGLQGSEQHTEWSPSYFNVLEASTVRDYCVKLIGDPERKIYPEEISVIAPYKSQVRAIRELLKVAKLSDISVGSVEEFQGQERKVIILATTRSDEESHPRKASGFLVNHQGMNVAITRAQALLIVIGDPELLGKDERWRTFLNYIKSRNGWTGKMHSWKPEEVVHVPGYEIVPRKEGGIVYGEEFIGGKSEGIYRSSESSGK
ncbi:P-loop containing nucleoside triphosphate hydrolase protein [Russula brevipes]|nr:P-loop containing nucleoside triphosphate hydrolase protein [Russula brevipes]